MPFLPTFNDLKSVGSSINPLNFFSDAIKTQQQTSDGDDEVGKAGPGPSSLANRSALQPSLQSDSSSSGSSGSGEGIKAGHGREVTIQEDDFQKRDKKKKVPMDSFIIVKPAHASAKNALNLQVQLVVGKGAGGRGRSNSTASNQTGPRSASVFLDPSSARTIPPPSTPPLTAGSRITLGPIIQSEKEGEGLPPTGSDSPDRLSGDEERPARPSASTGSPSGSRLGRITSRKSSSSSIPLSMTSISGQKRIQPVFNLNVHNVMSASIVTDAGTDAKVAKFNKRSIDMFEVGILEPTEIWSVPANSTSPFPPTSALEESKSRPMSMYSTTNPLTPTVTRSDRASVDILRPEIIQEGGASAKRFFGKIGGAFKKKTNADKEAVSQSGLTPSPSFNNGVFPPSPATVRRGSKEASSVAPGTAVGPPTFGCSPNVIARKQSLPRLPPCTAEGLAPPDTAGTLPSPRRRQQHASIRPIAYSWTVTKWAKQNMDGWAANLIDAVSSGVTMQGSVGGGGEDEVIFEWVKMRPPTPKPISRSRRSSFASRGHSRPPSTTAGMESPSTSRTVVVTPAPTPPLPSTPGAARPAPIRRTSTTPSLSPRKADTPLPDDSSAIYHTAEEDDSDPEDSETPWTCTLVVKRTGQKQLIGTLTPAPHHPKVVAQLRTPSHLDTICLADLVGSKEHVEKVEKEVCLSDQAVKDVMCVTALWLVAREGWNGLGQIKKGR